MTILIIAIPPLLFIAVVLLATFTSSAQRESAWNKAKTVAQSVTGVFDRSDDEAAGVNVGPEHKEADADYTPCQRVVNAMNGPSTFSSPAANSVAHGVSASCGVGSKSFEAEVGDAIRAHIRTGDSEAFRNRMESLRPK